MFYRRKILLALLEKFNGNLNPTDFQKYLFLFSIKQAKRSFDFVPYKFGCFSFQSYADKRTLTKYGYLEATDNWVLKDRKDFSMATLKHEDVALLNSIHSSFKDKKGDELIRHVYKNYPYYAINSIIINRILDTDECKIINDIKTNYEDRSKKLFTIGYEGVSLEEYINKLIQNNVKILCDVRKNPISMKWGFSKSQLKTAVENVGITYIHIPELGINSELRTKLISLDDYNALFKRYDEEILPNKTIFLTEIMNLIKQHKRIALTCFEANPTMCHRSRIVLALSRLLKQNIDILDL